MPNYRTEAVVLRTYKLAEADRIVVLYTRHRGIVRAVAKGVRRTKSKFGSRLEPGSIVHIQLYDGRNLDVVNQVETARVLPELRRDLTRYGRASMLLEAVDQLGMEGESNPPLYQLLVGALVELNDGGSPLVVPAFVGKLLALEGVQPALDRCVVCDRREDLVAVAIHLGGTTCTNCRQGEAISEQARMALQAVLDGRVRHVLETTTPEVGYELEHLTSRLLEQHLERRLRSADVLHHHLQG